MRTYGALMCHARRIPVPDTDECWFSLWRWMPTAAGYATKLEPVKVMRWMSANAHFKEDRSSFWITKMLLVFDKGEITDDSVFSELLEVLDIENHVPEIRTLSKYFRIKFWEAKLFVDLRQNLA